jgi:uncharacterized protein YlxW (UPF0749 family)
VTLLLSLITRLMGLFGFSLSKFWTGAILTAVLGAAFVGYSGYLVRTGYIWAEGKCEAASLKQENQQLAAALADTKRQLAAANEIQQRDAQRAQDAEQRLQANEEAVNATPVDPDKCLDRAASARVRSVR